MRRIYAKNSDFKQQLTALLQNRDAADPTIIKTVQDIIAHVRRDGDAALIEYTEKFEDFTPPAIRLDPVLWKRKAVECPGEVTAALEVAAARIAEYSQRQMPEDHHYTDAQGVELGWRWQPVSSAGLYVPGGLAAYPSSVLMNAVPAKVAGVARLAVTVPCPKGILNPVVLKACEVAGVDEIYTIGGAGAIAALAYGTQQVLPVDVIVGPGNAYVAEAKRQVFGRVGIDMIAGPSEVLIVADSDVLASWIAQDMLAQAEHDPRAQSIVIVEDENYAGQIEQAVKEALANHSRKDIAGASIAEFGAMIIVENIRTQAVEIINQIAPEHLQLAITNPGELAKQVQNAGAIFLGALTSEAIGDYIAGPSHVLPTSGTARFASGLSVFDFLKRSSWITTNPKAFASIAPQAITLADEEGLESHANSMRLRLGNSDE